MYFPRLWNEKKNLAIWGSESGTRQGRGELWSYTFTLLTQEFSPLCSISQSKTTKWCKHLWKTHVDTQKLSIVSFLLMLTLVKSFFLFYFSSLRRDIDHWSLFQLWYFIIHFILDLGEASQGFYLFLKLINLFKMKQWWVFLMIKGIISQRI